MLLYASTTPSSLCFRLRLWANTKIQQIKMLPHAILKLVILSKLGVWEYMDIKIFFIQSCSSWTQDVSTKSAWCVCALVVFAFYVTLVFVEFLSGIEIICYVINRIINRKLTHILQKISKIHTTDIVRDDAPKQQARIKRSCLKDKSEF